ncbi:MAG: cyclase family protein [Isosphaeraceae bacterium]
MMIYDITPPITPSLQVWPGDTPPTREVLLDMARGDAITLSTLHTTVHLGAHADGPNHYGRNAPGIDARSLEDYLGPCQVVDARVGKKTRVRLEDLAEPVRAERVLIRTGTYLDATVFNEDFAALDPLLVATLAAQGVRLIGIDTPSVDLFDSRDLPSHQAFLKHDLAILEGLVLAGVPSGHYELIALPLRLVGFDASPVRAILRTQVDRTIPSTGPTATAE